MFFRRAHLDETERSLLQRAADWPHDVTWENLAGETLRRITRSEGIDFATTLLFDRFQKSPGRAKFIQRINSLRQAASPPRATIDATVVIVPGALYVEHPEMGGDGRLVREVAERFGCQTVLLPVASFGSVTKNAGLIRAWLEQHSGERMILVSLSKGGADLKMALAPPDAEAACRNVVAWVNVCGPLNGSAMADWVLTSRLRTWFFRWRFRRKKRDFQFITDLRRGPPAPLDFPVRPPLAMRMLSLIGFPLRRHMTTRFSRFCHRTLAAHGPNDGTASLADLSQWPGEIYPAWGMDHYFRPETEARHLVEAMFHYLAEELSSASRTDVPRRTTPLVADI